MQLKTYKRCVIILTIILGIIIGVSFVFQDIIVPAVSVLVAILILYFCRRKLAIDEAIIEISHKSYRAASNLFVMAAAITGIILVALKDSYPQFTQIGLTLAYSVCIWILVYLVFYWFYSRK